MAKTFNLRESFQDTSLQCFFSSEKFGAFCKFKLCLVATLAGAVWHQESNNRCGVNTRPNVFLIRFLSVVLLFIALLPCFRLFFTGSCLFQFTDLFIKYTYLHNVRFIMASVFFFCKASYIRQFL